MYLRAQQRFDGLTGLSRTKHEAVVDVVDTFSRQIIMTRRNGFNVRLYRVVGHVRTPLTRLQTRCTLPQSPQLGTHTSTNGISPYEIRGVRNYASKTTFEHMRGNI